MFIGSYKHCPETPLASEHKPSGAAYIRACGSFNILQAVIQSCGVPDELFGSVCVVVDKIEKMPRDKVGHPATHPARLPPDGSINSDEAEPPGHRLAVSAIFRFNSFVTQLILERA
eukprot:scaffold630367_cov39-Prasinocladus_malaysianus.AAC.2